MADETTPTPEAVTETVAEKVKRYLPIARRIANSFVRKVPRNVLPEDLHAAAAVGLYDAVRRGQDVTHPTFEFYLRRRVVGAIQDELRHEDWAPRRARSAIREGLAAPVQLLRFEDIGGDGMFSWQERFAIDAPSPEDDAALKSEYALAMAAPLGDRLRYLLHLTETKGLRFKDAAALLGVSEPRISQLHARAFEILRAHMDNPPTKAAHDPNHSRTHRSAGNGQGRDTNPEPDPDRVRASGLGAAAPGRLARAVPRGGRGVRLANHAPSAGLGRALAPDRVHVAPAADRDPVTVVRLRPGASKCGDVLGGAS